MFPTLVRPLILAALLGAGADGCRERPGAINTAAQDAPTAVVTPTQPPSDARLPADGCIRGGTTRAEVSTLLGPPDSISWGVWLYGRSEVTFGYGVVVAFTDTDENLMVC